VFIPNVFSPNGDGINDYFEVYGGADIRMIKSFTIFDRWGAPVYNARDHSFREREAKWDGTILSQPAKAGVYIYVIQLEFLDGQLETRTGEVFVNL